MLILSRRRGQSIYVGKAGVVLNDPVKVTIVEVRNGTVRVGIEANPDCPVHRQEVYEAIQAAHAEASKETTNEPT